MLGAEEGIFRAIKDFLIGLAVACIIDYAIVPLFENGGILSFAAKFLIILLTLRASGKINYWSFTYLVGYTIAYMFMGKLFSLDWTDYLALGLAFAFIMVKGGRKIGEYL